MVDLSVPLFFLFLGAAGMVDRGDPSRARPAMKWLAHAFTFAGGLAGLAYLIGVGIRAPVPEFVAEAIGAAGVIMIVAQAVLTVRDTIRMPDANGISAPD